MEHIFHRKNNFQSKITVVSKTGFPPFAIRSLPSGNSGVPIRAISPVVRISAHVNKRVLRKQKPQHAPACKHPGYTHARVLLAHTKINLRPYFIFFLQNCMLKKALTAVGSSDYKFFHILKGICLNRLDLKDRYYDTYSRCWKFKHHRRSF